VLVVIVLVGRDRIGGWNNAARVVLAALYARAVARPADWRGAAPDRN